MCALQRDCDCDSKKKKSLPKVAHEKIDATEVDGRASCLAYTVNHYAQCAKEYGTRWTDHFPNYQPLLNSEAIQCNIPLSDARQQAKRKDSEKEDLTPVTFSILTLTLTLTLAFPNFYFRFLTQPKSQKLAYELGEKVKTLNSDLERCFWCPVSQA
ncbi:uncharacterized protein MEPE_01278 [Melanopsichium pennsylvanicum]|uniref:Uncharacterized protein n=1 Tax=Melanopsichium pennsylvanicum TaxID=63383 RepID=A0AAJ4XIB9_9BASI|nr:uncharacterized protein MEPE_01278 [Melanopsichium pennsylvanicum]